MSCFGQIYYRKTTITTTKRVVASYNCSHHILIFRVVRLVIFRLIDVEPPRSERIFVTVPVAFAVLFVRSAISLDFDASIGVSRLVIVRWRFVFRSVGWSAVVRRFVAGIVRCLFVRWS